MRRSGFGWMELLEGIMLIVLGIISFIKPESMLTGFVLVCGIVAVVTGIMDIIFYVKIDRHMGFAPTLSLVTGILSVLTGFMLVVYPSAGIVVISILFPLWFIMHCISRLSHLNVVKFVAGNGYYYFSLILNIIGIILGCMMIFDPALTLMSASYLIGIYFLLSGVDSVIMAFSDMGHGW